MAKNLISVIMPAYNAQEDIAESVQILLEQTYEDLELLLIDDGSNDETGKICNELAQTDPRIRVFHQDHAGCSAARNKGLQEAKGQYIMFLDPDDWLENDAFEKLIPIMQEQDLDVVRFNHIRELRSKSVERKNSLLKETVYEGEECKTLRRQTLGVIRSELNEPADMRYLTSACMCIYRAEVIREHNITFMDMDIIGDFADGVFNMQVLEHTNRFLFVDEPLFHYCRFNKNALTEQYIDRYLEKKKELFRMLKAWAKETEDPDFMEAYHNRVIFSVLDLCGNVLQGEGTKQEHKRQIREILNDPDIRESFSQAYLGYFPREWKMYLWLAQNRLTGLLYSMTKDIFRL
jgi:glycosyltransferase EpsH